MKKHFKSSKPGGGSGFKYHPRGGEAIQRRAEQQGGQFDSIFKDGVDKWRPKDGENVIRILPPTWEDHDHYGLDIWIHGYVGPDRSTYLCPQKMNNEPCPICKAERDAKAEGEEDEAKQLKPRRQVAVWIIDRGDEAPMPKLFTMSWSMDRDIASLCHNKRTGKVLLIDHPDEGYDISFTRTGKGLNTRYIGMAVDRESSSIVDDEGDQEKILEYIQENPIPDLLNFYDSDYLGKVIEGGAGERDEELDGAEESGKSRTRSRRGARHEEEKEEEERLTRTGRARSRRGEVDEEEDEPTRPRRGHHDQEEEGEEDAKPRGSRGRRGGEEDEPDADPDEVEEKQPARGRRAAAEVDNEEEDPDADPDEDEPAPPKRGGSISRRRR